MTTSSTPANLVEYCYRFDADDDLVLIESFFERAHHEVITDLALATDQLTYKIRNEREFMCFSVWGDARLADPFHRILTDLLIAEFDRPFQMLRFPWREEES